MSILALENIRHNGDLFEKGDVIEGLEKVEEERLVRLNSAEYFKTKTKDVNNREKGSEAEEEITEEEYQHLHDQLDKAFNKEPLIEAAEKAGVDLADDVKKKKENIINEIIMQGLEEEVLDMQEGD